MMIRYRLTRNNLGSSFINYVPTSINIPACMNESAIKKRFMRSNDYLMERLSEDNLALRISTINIVCPDGSERVEKEVEFNFSGGIATYEPFRE